MIFASRLWVRKFENKTLLFTIVDNELVKSLPDDGQVLFLGEALPNGNILFKASPELLPLPKEAERDYSGYAGWRIEDLVCTKIWELRKKEGSILTEL